MGASANTMPPPRGTSIAGGQSPQQCPFFLVGVSVSYPVPPLPFRGQKGGLFKSEVGEQGASPGLPAGWPEWRRDPGPGAGCLDGLRSSALEKPGVPVWGEGKVVGRLLGELPSPHLFSPSTEWPGHRTGQPAAYEGDVQLYGREPPTSVDLPITAADGILSVWYH